MKKTFYLIRHGDKEDYKGDPGLNRLGHEKAHKTAEYLKKNVPVSRIVASPMLRTRQTAAPIARTFSLEVEVSDLLRERMEFNSALYKNFEEYLAAWSYHTKNRTEVPSYGDSAYTAGARVASLISSFEKEKDEHIVLVTHGGAILDYLTNVFAPEPMNTHVPNYQTRQFQEILVHECTITTVRAQKDSYEFVSFGYSDHLD